MDNCSVLTRESDEFLEATRIGLLGLPEEPWERDHGGLCSAVWADDVAPPSPKKGVVTAMSVVGVDPAAVQAVQWLAAVLLSNLDLVSFVLCCKARHRPDYAEAIHRMTALRGARRGLDGRRPVGDDLDGELRVDPDAWQAATERFLAADYWSHVSLGASVVDLPGIFLDTGDAIADVSSDAGALAYYDSEDNRIALALDRWPFSGFLESFSRLAVGDTPAFDDPTLLALNILVHEVLHFLIPEFDHPERDWDPTSATRDAVNWPNGSPHDFDSCDVVNVATNAFTWAFVTRQRLRAIYVSGASSVWLRLSQSFFTDAEDEYSDDAFFRLWGFPGLLRSLPPLVVSGGGG